MSNQIVKANNQGLKRLKFSQMIQTDGCQELICKTLSNPKDREHFTAAIVSAVSANPALQECDAKSILSAALLGEALKLSPSPQLGQYYLIPYECTVKDANGNVVYLVRDDGQFILDEYGKRIPQKTKIANFQIGYRGLKELALRTGQYKKLNAISVKEGELKYFNLLTEEFEFNMVDDRDSKKTVGYIGMFELVSGFVKVIYWSKEKMISHADEYSPAFSKNGTYGKYAKVSFADYEAGNYDKKTEWLYSSHWYKNFDDMAHKTILKQLIQKWGVMSVDFQVLFEREQEQEQINYEPEITEPEPVDLLPTNEPKVIGQPELRQEQADTEQMEQVNINDL